MSSNFSNVADVLVQLSQKNWASLLKGLYSVKPLVCVFVEKNVHFFCFSPVILPHSFAALEADSQDPLGRFIWKHKHFQTEGASYTFLNIAAMYYLLFNSFCPVLFLFLFVSSKKWSVQVFTTNNSNSHLRVASSTLWMHHKLYSMCECKHLVLRGASFLSSVFYVPLPLSLSLFVCVVDLDNFKTQKRSPVRVREGGGVVLLCGPPPHMGGKTKDSLWRWSILECLVNVVFCVTSSHGS